MKSWPRWRIATNAEAQNTSVQATAARGNQDGIVFPVVGWVTFWVAFWATWTP